MPKLFIGGAADSHTTSNEVQEMFAEAAKPRDLWIVAGARHVDLCRFEKAQSETRILDFLSRKLRLAR